MVGAGEDAGAARAVRHRRGPRTAVIVGGGVVGLSTAWFLQEQGVEVTVVAGPNDVVHSNAELVAPFLVPLHEPAALRRGLSSLLRPSGARGGAGDGDPARWGFPARVAANRRWSSWTRAVLALRPLTEQSIDAFDVLTANGVAAVTTETSIVTAFRTLRHADGLLGVLDRLDELGAPVTHTGLFGETLRDHMPIASPALSVGVCVEGQRHVDAAGFVQALRRSVVDRGGVVQVDEVLDIHEHQRGAGVVTLHGGDHRADAVVVTSGEQQLPYRLPNPLPSHGFAFTVPVARRVPAPLYLPEVGVMCTPTPAGLRVATTAGSPGYARSDLDTRARSTVAALRPLLDGVYWRESSEVTPETSFAFSDGRPLIGATAVPGVYAARGLGPWEFAHGPAAGRLLAEQIVTRDRPAALRAFGVQRAA
ncbi:FAD-dependent oxidoreductase [Actinophytocola sp. KF-1]